LVLFAGLLSFILHLDKHLVDIISKHGKTTYAILFGIVFCETGLVLTPFLPGKAEFCKGCHCSPKFLNSLRIPAQLFFPYLHRLFETFAFLLI
jgi:hypothetical protein